MGSWRSLHGPGARPRGSYEFRQDMARLAAQCRALAVQAQEVAKWTAIGLAARSWTPSALYLFYPRHEDGSLFTFEAHNCSDDDEAMARAEQVLRAHDSSVEVVVWLGDRRIGSASCATPPG
jgi:hypothetical protein